MKENQNKVVVIICVVAIILIIVLLVTKGGKKEQPNIVEQSNGNEVVEEFVEKKEDGSKENISEQLKKNKTIEGVELTNIQLVENGNLTQLIADATNTTNSTIDELDFIVTAIDKNGQELAEFEASVYMLGPGKTTKLNAGITKDIVNAYDFTVRKK